ncbi:hypothetical protein I4J20_09820 [Corynebacterium belfantii]|nr:hypothetical protein [Corynebacterium belfantii]
MTENTESYHLSGKPRPTTRIAPTNYAETAPGGESDDRKINESTGDVVA